MTVVTGVIGSDVHCIGLKILEHALRKDGFQVASLGIQAKQEELIAAAIETGAPAILISSLYGHAELDCRGLRDRCTESGLDGILLYIGGMLEVTSQAEWPETEQKFRALGFDRVYPPRASVKDAIADLRADLAKRSGRRS
ncbi:MAG: methylaspartate mutase subunit S [Chloroflexi bacterium]|nr:methylaspartate mutase subunit S [Chloroflexota bacterium]